MTRSCLALCLLLAHPLFAQAPTRKAESPKMLFDFDKGELADIFALTVKGVLGPRPSPACDAGTEPRPAGRSMRIQGFPKTFVCSKADKVPADWRQFEALSFWVHRSEEAVQRHPSTTIEVQVLEEPGVRFWRKLELHHTGWEQFTLPLRWFSPGGGRLPRWDRVRHLGFLFHDQGEVLLDNVALSPGSAFVRLEDLLPLAFPGRSREDLAVIGRPDLWLLSDVKNAGWEKLAAELAGLQRGFTADLGVAEPAAPPCLIVFATAEQYWAFPGRLAAQYLREADAPQEAGSTVMGLATTSWDPDLGTRRPVCVHEFVHSLIERYLRLDNRDDWFQEGLASWYQERLRPQADLAKLVKENVLVADRRRPLESICGPQGKLRSDHLSAFTIVGTLASGKYRARLPRLAAAFAQAKSTNLEPHLAAVLETDWAGLTKDWLEFCEQTWGK
jgi:hypothetical protein